MSNHHQPYKESIPPTLSKILHIKHPQKDLSIDFWENIVDFQAVEVLPKSTKNQSQTNEPQQYQLLISKGKMGSIVVWQFQSGCLLGQKTLHIEYAVQKDITMVKILPYRDSIAEQPQLNTFVIVGYCDGFLEIYRILNLEVQSAILSRQISIRNQCTQPVTDTYSQHGDLFVVRTHSIFMYSKAITELCKKIFANSKRPINSTETVLKIKQLQHSTKLKLTINKNIHVYNQIEGVFSFSRKQLKSCGSIVDSVKYLCETDSQNLIIGSSDDSMKIVYGNKNEIERFTGFKNFVSQIVSTKTQGIEELWVFDMHGDMHYLVKKISSASKENSQSERTSESLVMFEESLTQSVNICPYGIKRAFISEDTLVCIDVEMNATVFDIIYQPLNSTERETITQ